MKTHASGLIEKMTARLVDAVNGTGDIAQVTVDTVRDFFSNAMKNSNDPGASITETIDVVANAAVRGASQAGGDLGRAATGLMLGVMRASRKPGVAAMKAVSDIAQATIQNTAAVGGDLESTAADLVQGAFQGANELALNAADVVSAASDGIFKAAQTLGPGAIAAVRAGIEKARAAVGPATQGERSSK
jgi:hypothetical protein